MTSTCGSVRRVLGPVKSRLTGLIGKVKEWVEGDKTGDLDLIEGKNMADKLDRYLEKFNETVCNLEITSEQANELDRFEGELEGLTEIMLDAEDVRIELKNKLEQLSLERRDSQGHQIMSPIASVADVSSRNERPTDIRAGEEIITTRLPKIPLPVFSGIKSEWFQFWERFESTVHCKQNLSKVDKFNFLKAQLTGEAAQCIAGLSLTCNNYDSAVSLLKNRFANKNLIIDEIYSKFRRMTLSNNSTAKLRETLDEIENYCRSLEGLGEDINHSSLVSLIKSKFPAEVLLLIEELGLHDSTNKDDDNGDIDCKTLRTRLDRLITARERVPSLGKKESSSANRTDWNKKENFTEYKKPATTDMLFVGQIKCRFCGLQHWSDECLKFRTVESRKEALKGSCFICLKKFHTAQMCSSKKTCYHCRSKTHHRSLCPKLDLDKEKDPGDKKVSSSKSKNVQLITCPALVSMQTATVEIGNPNKKCSKYKRIILDSGSHRSYITETLANTLGLVKGEEESLSICVFGASRPKTIQSYRVNVEIRLTDRSFITITANVVPCIVKGEVEYYSNLDRIKEKFPFLNFADKPELVEENFEIDLLIGNNYYFDIICLEKIEIRSGLYLVNSKIGWILSGRDENETVEANSQLNSLLCFKNKNEPEVSMEDEAESLIFNKEFDLKQFWSLETLGIKEIDVEVGDDDLALQQFEEKIAFKEGRYSVSWPWREYPPTNLANNYGLALGRLKSLHRKLSGNKDLIIKYDEIIKQQLELGIVEEVTLKNNSEVVHYLPHHPVITPQKSTTKIRIVYDGSASSGRDKISLNESLFRGRVLLEGLVGIALRFRLDKIAVICDIEKAFLQIALNEDSRDVTRFIWLKDPMLEPTDENLKEFRFCRVLFGVISSPFMLNAVVKYHVNKSESKYASKIGHNIYTDNLIVTFDSIDEAHSFYKETKNIFNSASMNMREWNSNNKEYLELLSKSDVNGEEKIKVLGIPWDTVSDKVGINIKISDLAINKRQILKVTSSIFDPLGLVCPVTIKGKIFIKNLWEKKLEWDESIDNGLQNNWNIIQRDLANIGLIKIPRSCGSSGGSYELHCFCDASAMAYATVIYLKNIETSKSKLIFAKARVSPTKVVTIPRLELLGVVIGCRCLRWVEEELKLNIIRRFVWTDSKCVLSWIKSHKPLPIFVERRIAEIKTCKNISFRFVNGELNIADVATRGCSVIELIDMTEWWEGPYWLLNEDGWPENVFQEEEVISKEQIVETILSVPKTEPKAPFLIELEDYSDLKRVINVTCWCQRAIKEWKEKCQNHKVRKTRKRGKIKDLTVEEIEHATEIWIKYVQACNYEELIEDITHNRANPLKKQLGLYLDEKRLIRCKGRFEFAELEPGEKCPVLLPTNSHLTKLIIRQVHNRMYHVGTSHTLAELRRTYWIPKGRAAVAKIIRKCVSCKKLDGKPFKYPETPPLPEFRVTKCASFSATGLDYLGPLWVNKQGKRVKVWVCLFTCLVVRAVHLEIINSLSAEDFLMCLRRFIARRGTPRYILSDNATCFKAVEVVINRKVVRDKIGADCAQKGIQWVYTVEVSPWMGGAYERLIGLTKRCLKKTLGRVLLSKDQLVTVVVEVEAVLNSRPLVYVGAEEGETLTPAHFLNLRETSVPLKIDLTNEQELQGVVQKNLLSTWKKGMRLLEAFWNCWKGEYLLNLRERKQKEMAKGKVAPRIGDIVHIADKTPRHCWKLGKIEELNISRDGMVRSAKVKTEASTLTRPVSKLHPLEIQESRIVGDCED